MIRSKVLTTDCGVFELTLQQYDGKFSIPFLDVYKDGRKIDNLDIDSEEYIFGKLMDMCSTVYTLPQETTALVGLELGLDFILDDKNVEGLHEILQEGYRILVKNVLPEVKLNLYEAAIEQCRELFLNKTKDYGASWRILRPSSVTFQILIKAKRIRSIEESGVQKVDDPILDDYIGIFNYAIIALIQLSLDSTTKIDLGTRQSLNLYDQQVNLVRELKEKKDHDYGEAWKDLSKSSIIDLILMKLNRIEQIQKQEGRLLVSEGVSSNFMDIANYAIFSILKMQS
jgi:hypothetical protein